MISFGFHLEQCTFNVLDVKREIVINTLSCSFDDSSLHCTLLKTNVETGYIYLVD